MQQVDIRTVKADLSRLIEAALGGEEIIISKGGKPVVRLAPVTRGGFQIGLLRGQLGAVPDFFEPMHMIELNSWEADREKSSREQ
jgi:prevent-host-death family protein